MTPEYPRVPAIRTPRKALDDLRNMTVPVNTPSDAIMNLVIRIDQAHINVRELTAYLDFIERTYGRLTVGGLTSYAQKREIQLEISSVRSGSIEIIISELIANSDNVTRIIIVYLLLKYVPSGYRDYEEARLMRERRKQLREQIRIDAETSALDRERSNQLVRFLDTLYQQETNRTPRVRRFAIRYVRQLFLEFRRKE